MSISNLPNDHTLANAMGWLADRLQHFLAEDPSANEGGVHQPPMPAALCRLSEQLGLSSFEQKVLLLCAGATLAPDLAGLYAQAQGDPQALYPTFALALSLFEEADWTALSPDSPLRYWHLLEIDYNLNRPLTISSLRADERIVNYLQGLNQLDHRLRPFLLPMPPEAPAVALPPSQQQLVDQALAYLMAYLEAASRPPILQLVGSDALSKRLVAQQIAARLGVQLYSLPAQALPTDSQKLEDLARLWQRESALLPLALYLDVAEIEPETPNGDLWQRVQQFLYRSNGLFMLDIREFWSDIAQVTTHLDVHKPTPAEQITAWQAVLSPLLADSEAEAFDLPARLTAQFNLNLPTIYHIATNGLNGAIPAERPPAQSLSDQLWQACLTHTRPRLDKLAQRITPKATWADIVLPQEQLRLLHHIADQIPQRSQVYESWGFRRRSSRGLGITVLFAGESGTGKTMAAEILANHLQLNLYRIDLSAVVSKYIGETEKNLRRLFDAAEDGGALLFFDEADALFGKRSEVKDSHDRYANIEINYLLQRLEAYQGLAILATNMKSGLDEAFTRRLRFSITFQKPDMGYRQQIWQKIFPPETPLNGLDYEYLAHKFNLSGGSIYNVALNAAFMAATAETPVSMPHVLAAIRIEMMKEDRLLNDQDFIWKDATE
jgi:hypothetical protein